MWRSQGIVLAVIAASTAGQAYARPRDDVMIGAYRCAAIAPTRMWLDCYYGAAQPQRAQLGLIDAPKAQVQLSLSPPLGGIPQDQPVRDQVLTAAARCTSLGDERQWLSCYYAAAVPARALMGLAAAPPAPIAQSPRSDKGARARGNPGPIKALLGAKNIFIESPMASYHFDPQHRFTITLANGQSWQQLGSDRLARWSKPPAHYVVNITGGVFGSYNLAIKGESGFFKVQHLP